MKGLAKNRGDAKLGGIYARLLWSSHFATLTTSLQVRLRPSPPGSIPHLCCHHTCSGGGPALLRVHSSWAARLRAPWLLLSLADSGLPVTTFLCHP